MGKKKTSRNCQSALVVRYKKIQHTSLTDCSLLKSSCSLDSFRCAENPFKKIPKKKIVLRNQKWRKQIPNEALTTLRKVFWRSREWLSRELCSSQLPRNQISANYIMACCCAISVTSPKELGSGVTRWHSSNTFTDHYPALMSLRRAQGWGNKGVSEHHSAMCDLWVETAYRLPTGTRSKLSSVSRAWN